MRFKTFAGRDLAEIVPRIREELGPDAVILKQRPTRLGGVGGFFAQRGVEVLAADHAPTTAALTAAAAPTPPADAAASRPAAATAAVQARPATATALPPAASIDIKDADADSTTTLLRETFAQAMQARGVALVDKPSDHQAVTHQPRTTPTLRPATPTRVATTDTVGAYEPRARTADAVRVSATHVVDGLRLSPTTHPADPRPVAAPLDDEAQDLVLELERSGIPTMLCDALVREVRYHIHPFCDEPLRELTRRRIGGRIRCEQGWTQDGTTRRIAVVGGAGVGKSTAVANLATGCARVGMSVGLVVLDRGGDADHATLPRLGAGGSDADRALAYMAGSDVLRIATVQDAARAQKRLQTRDVILIDTPSDVDGALLAALAPHETHAVVPLGLADREVSATLTRLARLGAQRMLVTKTDEARFAGPLYALATMFDLPLSYIGVGPSIPGGLMPADGGLIANRILPIG